MDIAALQAFLAIAETGSFSRAAERIYLTQPAISKRIALLERELGATLFDRVGRRVQLTPAGQALAARARELLKDFEDVRRVITNLAGTIGGELRLAMSHHVGLHRLPPALKRFHDTHPDVRLDLRFMDSEQACQAVAQGELEVAIVTLPPQKNPILRSEQIWDDPLDFVVGHEHPLARESNITREVILSALGAMRNRVQVGMATNYLEVLKMLAAIGLGWSALPRTMIDANLAVIQIGKIKIGRRLGIVTHAGRTLSNAAQAMIQIVQE
jgi:DNA-binding transcriptional LysR family regulator